MKKRIVVCTIGIILLSGCKNLNDSNDSTFTTVTTIEPSTPKEQAHRQLLESLPEEADSDDWNLILVNEENPLPKSFEVPIVELESGKFIDERIIQHYQEWHEAGLEAGVNLYFASGHRSVELQRNNFNRTIEQHMAEGATKAEATAMTEAYIATPGHSEHHTGLAMDIIDAEFLTTGKGLHVDFGGTEAFQWMTSTMADYGFILRYPQGEKESTGIAYEPWHYRYVGEENARFIVEHHLTLEEYAALLEEREASTND